MDNESGYISCLVALNLTWNMALERQLPPPLDLGLENLDIHLLNTYKLSLHLGILALKGLRLVGLTVCKLDFSWQHYSTWRQIWRHLYWPV